VTTASIQADYQLNDKVELSAELRHVKEENQNATTNTGDGEGTLAAFKVGYDANKDVHLYAIAQGTLSKSGSYESNDLLTLGARAKINKKIDLTAEYSTGDRGEAATLGAEQSGLGHTFGLDYDINDDITFSSSVQTASLDKASGGITDRNAFSVGLGYKKGKSTGSSRLEYRHDKNNSGLNPEETEQWVTTNSLNYRVSPSLRLQGRLNYSETNDKISSTNDAKFTWDAMAQYHWINSEESQDTQHGAMVSVDRHIGKNLKVGIGYNFTNFDDDLRNSDDNAKGWFINLVGKF